MDPSAIHILTYPDCTLTLTGGGVVTTTFRDKFTWKRSTAGGCEPLVVLSAAELAQMTPGWTPWQIEPFVVLEALRTWFACTFEGKAHSALDYANAHGLDLPLGWREERAKAEATLLYVTLGYVRDGSLNRVWSAVGQLEFNILAANFIDSILNQ